MHAPLPPLLDAIKQTSFNALTTVTHDGTCAIILNEAGSAIQLRNSRHAPITIAGSTRWIHGCLLTPYTPIKYKQYNRTHPAAFAIPGSLTDAVAPTTKNALFALASPPCALA